MKNLSITVRYLVCAALMCTIQPAVADAGGNDVLSTGPALRVAYISANIAQAQRDPQSGQYRGVSIDVARELSSATGKSLTVIPLPTAADVIAAVQQGSVDLGFVAPNAERSGVAFSRPYMKVLQSAIVPSQSLLQSVSELDAPGILIGINTDDTIGVWLKRNLKQATVNETSDYSLETGKEWLSSGKVQAFAGGRQRLAARIQDDAHFRLLKDNFSFGVLQSIAVASDAPERLTAINRFIEQLRKQGKLNEFVTNSGIDGLQAVNEDPD